MLDKDQLPPTAAEIDAARARMEEGSGSRSGFEPVPLTPVPERAADPREYRHHKRRTPPDQVFAYIHADGRTVGYVARWERTEAYPDKIVRPLSWCRVANKERWALKGWPAPFPLYRLPELLGHPDAAILVVEGEKKASAAQTLFPDLAVVSPLGGASRAHQTDWSVVAGRRVIISPDHDGASSDFALKVCRLCREAGAAEILILPPEALGKYVIKDDQRIQREGEIPQGWDLDDAVADGWTAAHVEAHRADIDDTLRPFDMDQDVKLLANEFMPKHDGLYRTVKDEKGDISTVWTCSPLDIVALVRGSDGKDHGTLLRITDPDYRKHEVVVQSSSLAGDGSEILRTLRDHGLRYDASNRKDREAADGAESCGITGIRSAGIAAPTGPPEA